MSSLKCRCGSDDKIKFVKGKMIRIADGKPHVCLGGSTQAPAPPAAATIHETRAAPEKKRPAKEDEYLESQHKIKLDGYNKRIDTILELEQIVIAKLQSKGEKKPDGARVGLLIKLVLGVD